MSRRWTAALAMALAVWGSPRSLESEPLEGNATSGGTEPRSAIELLGGEVRNDSGSCGVPRALTIQFLGPMSPRIEVPPGGTQSVSLARGIYQAVIQSQDGIPEESPLVVADRRGFLWTFGCPPLPGGPSSRAGLQTAGSRFVAVRLANTTPDCGEPRTVVFVLNGNPAGTLEPGRFAEVNIPAGGGLLEVVSSPEHRRLLVRHLERVEARQTLHYGCTDPEFAARTQGVPVVFENATDRCPARKALTLWVDGYPRIGLLPGRATTLFVEKGLHEFDVREGLALVRLLRGERDVRAPFRIRYGCSQQD